MKMTLKDKRTVKTWKELGGVLGSSFSGESGIYIMGSDEFEDSYYRAKSDFKSLTGKTFDININEFAKYVSYNALTSAGYSERYVLRLVKWDNEPFKPSKVKLCLLFLAQNGIL